MKRLFAALPALAGLASSVLLASAAPAAAQGDGERINQLIVYGDEPCPASSGEEIVVCARKDEDERYRIPEILRQGEGPENEAWSQRVTSYETVGNFGTLSCSPSGYGGWAGCTQKLIDAAYAEKRGDDTVRFSELIAQERARRLSTIDADAAETQSRVEEIERQMEERQRREGEATGQGAPPSAPAGNLSAPPQE